MKLKTQDLLSDNAREALINLGGKLRLARIRRHESMALAAQRLQTTHTTLRRLERGDAALGIALYAAALDAYGFLSQLNSLADPDTDELGKTLEHQRLPKHVHPKRIDNDF